MQEGRKSEAHDRGRAGPKEGEGWWNGSKASFSLCICCWPTVVAAECFWKRCCKQVLRTTAPGTVVATIAGHSHQNGYVLDEVRKQSQQSPMSSSPEKPLLERCENVTCCCCVL